MEKANIPGLPARLDTLLSGVRTAAIVVHTHPDGDAVGSAAALLAFLREKRGIEATAILPDAAPDTLSFLTEGLPFLTASAQKAEAAACISASDLIFCLDCNGFSRVEGLETVLRDASGRKVLIDHHLYPEADAFDLAFSDPSASSTCEVLYRILTALPDTGSAAGLPAHSVTALMAGMTTDTNNFANSTTPSTLRMAADLLEAGADREAVLDLIYRRYRENRLRLLAHCLDGMRITSDGVAYMILDRETQRRLDMQDGETEGFVNEPLAIGRVRMSLFLKEDDGHFRVSIRSKRGTSAQRLAATRFHGGGHELAAGGKLYFPQDIAAPEEAASYIENVTRAYFQS